MFSSKLNDRKGADRDPRINQNILFFIIMASARLSLYFFIYEEVVHAREERKAEE